MAADRQQDQPGRRGPGKRFAKGASGNPNGRKAGSRNRVTLIAERIMEAGAESVAAAVVLAAEGGDMTAARLVLERIAPVRRGRPVEIALPRIESVIDVVKALGAIAAEMAAGVITPDEAQAIGAVIELKRRALEMSGLEKRILALEEEHKNEPA